MVQNQGTSDEMGEEGDEMDKQTAIDLLDNLLGMVEDNHESDYDTAIKMGIDALKSNAPNALSALDCVDRQAAVDAIRAKDDYSNVAVALGLGKAITAVCELPSVQTNLQLTCNKLATDCIDRKAAIDAFEERLKTNGYSNVALVSELNRCIGYLMQLPSVQPVGKDINVPCKDTISRRAAIDAINHICPVDTEYDCTLLDRVDVRCVLSDLPSVQPESSEYEELDFVKEHERIPVTLTVQPETEERTAGSAQNVPKDELISKKAAIDASCTCHGGKHCNHYPCKDVQAIMDLPSVQPQRWILVSEALPDRGKTVLITNDKGNVRCGRFRGVEFWKDDGDAYWTFKGNTVEHVLAWMPLPEPYEPQESEVKNEFSKTGRCDQQRADTDYH